MDLLARTLLISICGRHDTTGHGRVEILGVALLPAVRTQPLAPLSSFTVVDQHSHAFRADWDIHVLFKCTPSSLYTTLTLHYHHGFSHKKILDIRVVFFGFPTITHVIEICQPQMVLSCLKSGGCQTRRFQETF